MTRSPGKDGKSGRLFYQNGEEIRTKSIPNHVQDPIPELKSDSAWTPVAKSAEQRPAVRKRKSPSPNSKISEGVTPSSPTKPKRSKHDYGFFREVTDADTDNHQGVTSWQNVKNLFDNLTACCTETTGQGGTCGGKYKATHRVETGTGGELSLCITCDRCSKRFILGDGARCAQDRQHPTAEEPRIGKKMIYSHLLSSGSTFESYESFCARMDMSHFSKIQYQSAMKDVLDAVMKQLQDEIDVTKQWLRDNNLWSRGLLGLDGSWSTPGAAAPHGMFAARALKAFGALIGVKFMSRNDPKEPFMATSAAMEVVGCIAVLNILFGQGYGYEMLKAVCDGDTHAGKMIANLWTKYFLLACSGHINKNLGKCVAVHAVKKGALFHTHIHIYIYPNPNPRPDSKPNLPHHTHMHTHTHSGGVKGITSKCVCAGKTHKFTGGSKRKAKVIPVAGIDGSKILDADFVNRLKVTDLKQHLGARGLSRSGRKSQLAARLISWKPNSTTPAPSDDASQYCGCFNTKRGLLSYLKRANMRLLVGAGKDASWYRAKIKELLGCLTTLDHDHTDCAHHEADKPPSVAILVTCPFHREVLTNYLQKLMDNAERLIDPEIGRVHNNALEIGFAHVWRWCLKRRQMSAVRFRCFASIGLLHSNQTAMFHIRGPDYDAMNEVAKRLGMPVSTRMRAHTKKMAMKRKRKHDRANSKEQKIKRSMTRRRRQLETTARRRVSALIKKQFNLGDIKMSHHSEEAGAKLLEGVESEKVASDDDGTEDDEEECGEGEVTIAKFGKIMVVEHR